MSDVKNISNSIIMMVNTGMIESLEDPLDMEEVLEYYHTLEDDLKYYGALKQHRIEKINGSINKIKVLMDNCKAIARKTLEAGGGSKLSFPGVGRVSTRKVSGGYKYSDEDMIDFIESNLNEEDQVKYIRLKKSVAKKEASTLLSGLEKNNKLPEFIEKTEDDISVIIAIDKETDVEKDQNGSSLISLFGRAVSNNKIEDDRFTAQGDNTNLFDEL